MVETHWQNWDRNGRRREDLAPLLSAFAPAIDHEVHRWSGTGLPKLVLASEAKRQAILAFQDFKPDQGDLAPFVKTRLGQRMVNFTAPYRQDVRMPNERLALADKLVRARIDLAQELGREATDPELARRIGVGTTTIGKLAKFQGRLYSQAEEGGFNQPAREDLTRDQVVMDFLAQDLPPMQRLVFEHSTGYGGKPVLAAGEIAKKLAVSPGRVSQLKTDIGDRARAYQRAIGLITA